LCQNSGVGWFDSRRWWTVLYLIPFTTPYNRGLRILRRAAKGRVRAQCHPQTHAGGIEGGASTRPRRRQAGKAQRPRQAADPCGRSKTPKFASMTWRAERRQDYQRADAIKRANPASWKHVNLYEHTASWISAMGSTSRNWSISWRQPAVGAPRHRTEVAIL